VRRLFIPGAPKCGTTSLYNYLSTHPDIYFPQKEIHYYATDFAEFRVVKTKNMYERLYQDHPSSTKILGDASVWYLFSDAALKNIIANHPDAYFVIMLRNPIEMFRSLHQQKLYSLDESIKCPREAWRAQERRAKGMDISGQCRHPEQLQYKKVCSIGTQCEKALSILPESQVKIILSNRFVKNTQDVYEEILSFLRLSPNNETDLDFDTYNASTGWKSTYIAAAIKKVEAYYNLLSEPIKKYTNYKGLGMLETIEHASTEKKKPISDSFRKNYNKCSTEKLNV